jgi:hypothetical protein
MSTRLFVGAVVAALIALLALAPAAAAILAAPVSI